MSRNTRQFRVGLLVCGAVALFASLIMFIAGSALKSKRLTHYIAFEENVKGMVIGSKVNFQGVPIGAVTDIRFEGGKSLVEIGTDPRRAVIQEITAARLDRLLVTGQVTVELEGYAEDSPVLPPGSMILAKENRIAQLTMGLPDVLTRLDAGLLEATKMMRRLNRVLSDDNLARIDRMLAMFEETSERLPRAAESLMTELEAGIRDLRPLMHDARETLAQVARAAEATAGLLESEHTEAALAAGRRAFERLDLLGASLTALFDETRGLIGGNRQSVRNLMLAARETLREIHGLARNLRLAPSSLIYGSHASEIELPAAAPASRGGR